MAVCPGGRVPAEGSRLTPPPPVCPEPPAPEPAAAPEPRGAPARTCYTPIERHGVEFCYQLTASMVMHEPLETVLAPGLSFKTLEESCGGIYHQVRAATRNSNPDSHSKPNTNPKPDPDPDSDSEPEPDSSPDPNPKP